MARSRKRFRIRTKYLLSAAVLLGLAALVLLALAFVKGDFFNRESYITGFTVETAVEETQDGLALLLQGSDRSLRLSRDELGSDKYFRIKKAVQPGAFVRAGVDGDAIAELYVDGDCLLDAGEREQKQLILGRNLFYASIFAALIAAALVFGAEFRRRRRRARHARRRTS